MTLKYTKSPEEFGKLFTLTKMMSDAGTGSVNMIIAQARRPDEVGRKWAFECPLAGPSIITVGRHGHVLFSKNGTMYISRNYTQTQAYINDPDLVTELLEYSFYSGSPVFGLIEALDLQIDEPLEAHARIGHWRSIHRTLLKLQEGTDHEQRR